MNSKRATQAVKQLNQLSEEKFPRQKKEESSDDVVKEMIFDNSEKRDILTDQKIEEKQSFAKKRVTELEAEIRGMVLKRQQEVRERYKQEEKKDDVQQEIPSNIPPSKPKRGFGIRRIKSAQQQSQPETAGRRTAG